MEKHPHGNDSSQMWELLQPEAHKEKSSQNKAEKDTGGQETRTKAQSATGNSEPELKHDKKNTPSSPGTANHKKVGGSKSPTTGMMESGFGSGPSGPKEPQREPFGSEVTGLDAFSVSGRSTDTKRGRITYTGAPSVTLYTGQPSSSGGDKNREGPGHTGTVKVSPGTQSEKTLVPVEAGGVNRRRYQFEDKPSRCCSLDELKRLPQCDRHLGPLTYGRKHAVLVDVNAFNKGSELRPQSGLDEWSHNSVKMPHSQWSVVNVTKMVKTKTVRRWDMISEHLTSFSKKKSASVKDLEKTILKLNPKYVGQWSFDALSSFVQAVPKTDNYCETLFPKIAALALRLPETVKKAVPLLRRGHSAAVTLSQDQIACLLANAFFCTFPHRNTTAPNAEYSNYPTINFNSLFRAGSERKKQKLRAIMHYFNVVTDEKTRPRGLVTFERRCLRDSDVPMWRSCMEKMPKLHVTSGGAIEKEGEGMLQVDFAASRIGGGVLGSGLVQEEVLFLINPELILSRLFTEKLDDNECLIVKGSQQFSAYTGFSDSFKWTNPHEDRLGRDSWMRKQRHILAIDALHYRDRMDQYNMRKVTRELNKAYCGFRRQRDDTPDIATGKWGCGAFSGDPQLKAIIQLMAAAVANRGLAFFTFRDHGLQHELERVYTLLVTKDITVGKLYRHLEDYCNFVDRNGLQEKLFDFICLNIQTPGYFSRL